jgi:hypothetical protein
VKGSEHLSGGLSKTTKDLSQDCRLRAENHIGDLLNMKLSTLRFVREFTNYFHNEFLTESSTNIRRPHCISVWVHTIINRSYLLCILSSIKEIKKFK